MVRNIWEKVGAFTGVGGAILVAVNMDLEFYAFSAYFISNVAWLVVARAKDMHEIYYMSWVFMLITLLGFARL